MLIDSHCHLDAAEFDDDRAEVMQRATAAGVEMIVVPAVAARQFDGTARTVAAYAVCRAAYGIHPLYVGEADPERDLARLEARLADAGVVAVGEIGLDLYPGHPDPILQERLFAEQLRLARRLDLPVLLHVRRAVDGVMKHLRRTEVPGGIAHAFNGSLQQARQLIARGFKLGFGGAMTFTGSRRIRALAADLPLDAIVLESDAPDMAPAWGQGTRNEPNNVARYASTLAELRGISIEEVIAATGRNVLSCLPRC
ncbi:MAG: TatD family hydrolase, partial [Rhodocyclaceae bacterium]|nr:TatD family hydrolase [Rhodocyclaceae bacterium]